MHTVTVIEMGSRKEGDELLDRVEALLMVVNENELRAVIGLMEPKGEIRQVTRDGVTFQIGSYGKFKTAIVQTSQGETNANGASIKTFKAIRRVDPHIVISVGVAFGKGGSQRLGDVIVANEVYAYGPQKIGPDGSSGRGAHQSVSSRLLDTFENTAGWSLKRPSGEACKVIIAPIISGPWLVNNLKTKNELFERYERARGGEMEAAAILAAKDESKGKNTQVIIVKAISDWADGNKQKDWQPFAAHAAAKYVLHHLQRGETYDEFVGK